MELEFSNKRGHETIQFTISNFPHGNRFIFGKTSEDSWDHSCRPPGPQIPRAELPSGGPSDFSDPAAQGRLKAPPGKPIVTSSGLAPFGHPQPHGNTDLAKAPTSIRNCRVGAPTRGRRRAAVQHPPNSGGGSAPSPAPSQHWGPSPTSAPHPPVRAARPHRDHTCSRNPAAQLRRRVRGRSLRRPAPGHLAEAPGATALRRRNSNGPGGMPGRKLPGKLEQLERAGASLLHNSRAAAAGGETAHLPQSGPPNPAGARGRQRPGIWRGLCSAPGQGSIPTPGPAPGARSPGPTAAPAARTWMGALGAGAGAGVGAGSPGTLRPRHGSPPRALWRLIPVPLLGMQAQATRASGRRPRSKETPGRGGGRSICGVPREALEVKGIQGRGGRRCSCALPAASKAV